MKAFSLNYFLRGSVNKKNSQCRIFARLTVNGKRIDFSINRKTERALWDERKNCPRGRKESDRELTRYLATLEESFYKIERELIEKSIPVTASNLLQKYNEEKSGISQTETKHKTLFEVFDLHDRQLKEFYDSGLVVKRTLTRYHTTANYIREFINEKYKKETILLSELCFSFVTDFDHWLRIKKKCAQNTVVKYVKNLRKIIRMAIDNGWLSADPFRLYKEKTKPVNREYLNNDELDRLSRLTIEFPRLDNVRKMFLFSCYTGLAYIDLFSLTPQNIQTANDGSKWIIKPRKKTRVVSRIYLLPVAENIMNEFSNHPLSQRNGTLFPPISNQRLNTYMKELADLARIKKNLTFHIARHTFATTVTLANGISLESVSAQLGHTNIRQTQHYAKMVNSRIGNEMGRLKNLFR